MRHVRFRSTGLGAEWRVARARRRERGRGSPVGRSDAQQQQRERRLECRRDEHRARRRVDLEEAARAKCGECITSCQEGLDPYVCTTATAVTSELSRGDILMRYTSLEILMTARRCRSLCATRVVADLEE